MIEAKSLTKVYKSTKAVDSASFTIREGRVTGLLGPNGAGKTTTMRMIIGLDRPTSGVATICGKAYTQFRSPLREVGILLDARAAHPGRSAYNHLWSLAASNRIPVSRVDHVIEFAGLSAVAQKRVGHFSLGMSQRLGVPAAMLGDPHTVILDEPVNGLDPEGVIWVRELLRRLAAEGRTVLLSSHLMTELALTAEHIIVLGQGRVLADAPIDGFIGADKSRSLEDAYLEATQDEVEYRAGGLSTSARRAGGDAL